MTTKPKPSQSPSPKPRPIQAQIDSVSAPNPVAAPQGITSTVTISSSLLENHTSHARDVLEIAQGLTVTSDVEEQIAAGFLIEVVAEGIKAVKAALDPICQAAHKTHTTATSTRASLLRPFEQAEAAIKSAIREYQIEKRRREEEEQKERDREARRLAEEAALQEVGALLESGDETTALALAEQIETGQLVSPGIGPPVAKSTVASAPGMARVETWKYEIVDPFKIERSFLTVNEGAIGALVKRLGAGAESVVGAGSIRVYKDVDVRRTGR